MRRVVNRLAFALACAGLASCAAHRDAVDQRAAVARAADAARAFLLVLTDAQRKAATAPLGDPSRTKWGFVPAQYPGVMWGDLDAAQRDAARALLLAVLSDRGMATVDAILALENELHARESARGLDARHRDPSRYWLQVFGEPSTMGAWALRLQGHHVSLHVAFSDGAMAGGSPRFFGANPHRIPDGPRAGERVLAVEEDLARALLASLRNEQRAIAIVDPVAPPDIVLGPTRVAVDAGSPRGLSHGAMEPAQRAALWLLVERFAHALVPDFAEADLRRIRAAGLDAITFCWMGSETPGEGHYWRAQGPTFVVEYDCTQDRANHVHTVWRDFERDFGGDLLRAHYEAAHAIQPIPRSDF
jgi:hypothetical protein